MDEKHAHRLAALCAECCAKRDRSKCAQCHRAFKCKVVVKSAVKKSASRAAVSPSNSEPSSRGSPQKSAHGGAHAASPQGSAAPAERSASARGSAGSSAKQSRPSKAASKNSSVLDASVGEQPALAKTASKNSRPSDAEALPAANGEESPEQHESLKSLTAQTHGGNGVVVDGWDVVKFHDRKGFRSVNLVRALKFLKKNGYDRVVAFIPHSYVDIHSNKTNKKLADDPCLLQRIKDEKPDYLQFTDDKRHYAWEMLTYAKTHKYSILSNRQYEEKRKVKTPKDVQVSSEELDQLYLYVEQQRQTYTFKKVFALSLK